MPFRQICRVRCYLVGDDTILDVLPVRKSAMLLRRYVAEYRCPEPADHCCTDRRGDVVIPRGDIGYQRAKRIEGSLLAGCQLPVNILFDEMHWYVTRAFDHDLAIVLPGNLCQ